VERANETRGVLSTARHTGASPSAHAVSDSAPESRLAAKKRAFDIVRTNRIRSTPTFGGLGLLARARGPDRLDRTWDERRHADPVRLVRGRILNF
jgi:hypothetical protein